MLKESDAVEDREALRVFVVEDVGVGETVPLRVAVPLPVAVPVPVMESETLEVAVPVKLELAEIV